MEIEQYFYEGLYRTRLDKSNINGENWNYFFNNSVPTHSDCLQDLEVPLGEHEIYTAIHSSENNKSPGTDGLPVDFYKTMWPKVKPFMIKSFQQALATGSLSLTQNQGVICLFPKKDKKLSIIRY